MTEQQLAEQTEAVLAPAPDGPVVGIMVASQTDMGTMERAGKILREAEVRFEIEVMSVLREPDRVAEYCRTARRRGLKVLIAGASLGAALPAVAAAHTDLPVIGVPLTGPGTAVGGLDAILSVVQTPAGVPVATVGLDNAKNAAHLAVRILGI